MSASLFRARPNTNSGQSTSQLCVVMHSPLTNLLLQVSSPMTRNQQQSIVLLKKLLQAFEECFWEWEDGRFGAASGKSLDVSHQPVATDSIASTRVYSLTRE